MSVANKHDIATMKFKAADKEAVEKSAKTCWNKLTRFLDKFSEIVFIFCLTANAIWNLLSMFLGDDPTDKGFSMLRLLLSIYFMFLAVLIFTSWRANINFLTYFGFMRSNFSKCLFLLFCSCMSFPNKYSTSQNLFLSNFIAYTLVVTAFT